MFYSGTILRTKAWEGGLSALTNCFKEVREEPGYTEIFAKKKKSNVVEY